MTDAQQMAGCTVVLTADRRSAELATSFQRRGAQVVHAPTLRIVPLGEDPGLMAATERLLERPPAIAIVTTGIGLRGWIEAVDAAGRAPELLSVLSQARVFARGPKARGAIHAAGLIEEMSAVSETASEIVDLLLDQGVCGKRVAFQLHGVVNDPQAERLRAAGADVEAVPVYRWGPSPDPAAVRRAIDAICIGSVDAAVFTSAPGAQALLDAADDAGRLGDLLSALSGDVLAAAVGPVTAAPLVAAGLRPVVPDRGRLGALVRCVADGLAGRSATAVATRHGRLEVRRSAAILDGDVIAVSPAPLSVLRSLAEGGGKVLSRKELLASLPGAADEHAVEVAVARLRSSLERPGLIDTVVKRGYRLDV